LHNVLKTYIAGVVLGVVACLTALHFVPVVDLGRETSIIAVTPNGGTSETFHINIPDDRVMLGAESRKTPLPAGMKWPETDALRGSRMELFKVRDAHDAVIGVASRVAVQNRELGNVIEWVLHFPARGTLYVNLDTDATTSPRRGALRAGTREFEKLSGNLVERWVADGAADAPGKGKIELLATYLADSRNTAEEAGE
jgi:hypothetical protein